jgi:hypothetical protein
LLARKAADAGVVYSVAFGDQPALICDLVDWAHLSSGRGGGPWPQMVCTSFFRIPRLTRCGATGLTPEQTARGLNRSVQQLSRWFKPSVECTTSESQRDRFDRAKQRLAVPTCTSVEDIPFVTRPIE